jgi:hypothetical protein
MTVSTAFSWNDMEQDQLQGQAQGQAQGQLQGQIAAQGQLGEVSTSVEGDDVEVNAPTWPETPSTANKEEKSIYSLFGGIGSNKTEEQIRLVEQMKITEKLKADGLIDQATYEEDILTAYKQLKKSNRNQKLLGVIPVADRGCNVLNACGLLNW